MSQNRFFGIFFGLFLALSTPSSAAIEPLPEFYFLDKYVLYAYPQKEVGCCLHAAMAGAASALLAKNAGVTKPTYHGPYDLSVRHLIHREMENNVRASQGQPFTWIPNPHLGMLDLLKSETVLERDLPYKKDANGKVGQNWALLNLAHIPRYRGLPPFRRIILFDGQKQVTAQNLARGTGLIRSIKQALKTHEQPVVLTYETSGLPRWRHHVVLVVGWDDTKAAFWVRDSDAGSPAPLMYWYGTTTKSDDEPYLYWNLLSYEAVEARANHAVVHDLLNAPQVRSAPQVRAAPQVRPRVPALDTPPAPPRVVGGPETDAT